VVQRWMVKFNIMTTCKDCLHYEVCVIIENSVSGDEDYLNEFGCEDFKDRTKWAEINHSSWKFNKDGSGTCQHCHRTTRNVWDYDSWMRYCPDCGSRMDGDINE